MTEDIQTVAEQQRAFWNSNVGDKWVANQSALDRLFDQLTESLLQDARIKPGEKIIDVGCGAGTTTRKLADKVGAEGQVLGVDISTPLLAAASAQVVEDHVAFFEGDAGSAEIPLQGVDLIFSRFGVMFFADPVAAFSHMRKVLAPDGRLCFVCWSHTQDNPWFATPIKVIAARFAPLELAPARAPGPMAFAETDYIEEILGRAKFDNIVVTTREVFMTGSEGPAKTAEFLMEFGPGSRILGKLDVDEETKQQLIVDLAGQLEEFKIDRGMQFPATLHYVSATNSR